MKTVTVKLPEETLNNLNKLVGLNRYNHRRSERIRYVLRAMIRHEEWFTEDSLIKKRDMRNELKLYNFCIFCGMRLSNTIEPYKHKNYNITEFRACCLCLKKYKGKSLDELPEKIRQKIDKKLKLFFETP